MKRNESKALARAKRMYERLKDVPLIKKANGKWRACESITEFLSLKWVKIFKNTSEKRFVSDKLDMKNKNRKERHSKKKIIEEGIQEYESRYDEYYCPQCMHCVEGYCVEKHKWVNGNDYCEDFFD
jgi:hypothetical protein